MIAPSPATDWNTILLALIAALQAGFGAWLTFRANATHTAVNSERTKTTAEIKQLNETIAGMAEQFGKIQGAKRPRVSLK